MDVIELKHLLVVLNNKLERRQVKGKLLIAGGAALALAYELRQSTRDIDAVFEPSSLIRELAAEIADEIGVDRDWLNDGVKGFFRPDVIKPIVVHEFDWLIVMAVDERSLLAMKLTSARFGSNDLHDAIALAKRLGVSSVDELYDIAESHSYANQLTPKSGLFIQEIAQSLQKSSESPTLLKSHFE